MHLLVIEDERALCETIVRSLRRLAYSVDYCYDGEKALALLGVDGALSPGAGGDQPGPGGGI